MKKEGEEDSETWEERFRGHTDTRPYGPQSISFDVSFYNAEFVSGIPERATSLALKPTRGPGVEKGLEPYRLFNLDVFEYLSESPFGLYGSIPLMISHGFSLLHFDKLISLSAYRFKSNPLNPNNSMMGIALKGYFVVLLLALLSSPEAVFGIRFVIDREECFSHDVKYEGDTVHVSFVVVKVDSSWHYSDDGVDLVVKGPSGDQIHDFRDKISEKIEFVAHQKGVHRFCFTNKSPYHETIDFDVHVGHFSYYDEHAKDEHFQPLLEQISKLEEALYNIQFEQHWLEAQTDRQAIINDAMSRRTIHKAFFESAALVAASILQVYLLRRLFERKLGMSRV